MFMGPATGVKWRGGTENMALESDAIEVKQTISRVVRLKTSSRIEVIRRHAVA